MKRSIVLVLIIVLAAFLRLWQLGRVPVSPDWDEVALGYNAYSILRTGRDEYGTRFPLVIRSFDDYKPPLYVYLTVPSVAAFGLTVWAVRLPSALMGILAVAGTYVLVSELWRKRQDMALISSFLLAISPWHLQFSRIAFEANTGLTLNIWGMAAFLRGLTSLPWMLGSAFLFGLSLYAYHSERVFVPLLLLAAVIYWRKELFADRKKVIVAVLVGLLTIAPLVPVVLDKTSVTRLKGTSSLSDQTGLLRRSVAKLERDNATGNRLGMIFDNRRIVYARTLLDGYLSHFSFRWLFVTGDNDRHHAPDMGLVYLWELPLLLSGIFFLWKERSRPSSFLLLWMLLAPVAASPTSETPHAIRSLVVLPSLPIAVAMALTEGMTAIRVFIARHKGRVMRWGLAAVLTLYGAFAVANILYYFHMYYAHLNQEYSRFWQYGYKEAVEYATAHASLYDTVVVSTALEQPHMFFLFYTKYDPATYLRDGGTASGGFAEVKNRFGKFVFRPITNWARENHDGKTLYIGSPKEIPTQGATIIHYLNGEDAMIIAQ